MQRRVLVEPASAVCVSERNWTGHSAHRSSSCLVGVPETSLHEHLSSAWSSHVSIFGELTHSSASTGTNETWCRCPDWLCVGTACSGSPHLYCEPMVSGEETEAQRGSQSVQFSCDPMDCSTPGLSITNSRSLLKLMSIESVMPSNHLILCRLLLLLPSIFPSIRVFSNESARHIR